MIGLGHALEGITVVDLTRYLPGPWCSMWLADLGARVIKVEDRTGDPIRAMGPAFHEALNRGKQGICLDFRSPEGRATLRKLVARADVLMAGFRPGVMEELGLGYEHLRGAHPGLIYVSITGFGATPGPHRDRPGHDLTYQALAGLLDLGGADGPAMPGIQVADLAGASTAVSGILAALRVRDRTGEGQHLDIAIADAALAWNPLALAMARAGHPITRGSAPLWGALPRYALYRCADGKHFALGALEARFWKAFCDAVGHPEWVSGSDQGLSEAVAALFATRSRAGWADFFLEHDLAGEPVLSAQEALAHPQFVSRHLGEGLPDPLVRPVPPRRAPALGEHDALIHAELADTPVRTPGL